MQGDVAKPGMATDSRGHAPGDELQTDIPSRRLIIAGDDDPLEDRGAPEISVDRGFKSLRPHFSLNGCETKVISDFCSL